MPRNFDSIVTSLLAFCLAAEPALFSGSGVILHPEPRGPANPWVQTQAIIPRLLTGLHPIGAPAAGMTWSDHAMPITGRPSNLTTIQRYIKRMKDSFYRVTVSERDPMIRSVSEFFHDVHPDLGTLFDTFAQRKLPAGPDGFIPKPYLMRLPAWKKAPAKGHADDSGAYANKGPAMVHEFIAFMGQPHKAGLSYEIIFRNWAAERKGKRTDPARLAALPDLQRQFQKQLAAEKIDNRMTLPSIYNRALADIRTHFAEYEKEFGGRRPDLLTVMRDFEQRRFTALDHRAMRSIRNGFVRALRKANDDVFDIRKKFRKELLRLAGHRRSAMDNLILTKRLIKSRTILRSLRSITRAWPLIFSWLDEVAATGSAEAILIVWENVSLRATFARKASQIPLQRPHRWSLFILPTEDLDPADLQKYWIFTPGELKLHLSDPGERRRAA